MRRSDREVTDIAQIQAILDSCKTCHLAMVDGGRPYVVPLSYGYTLTDGVLTLYFHSAKEGRKIDVLRAQSAVCFEMTCEGEGTYVEEPACNSGCYFASVIGFGDAVFVEDAGEKCAALSQLMRHQAHMEVTFTPAQAESVCVLKVTATEFTGKQKPKPGA